MNGVCDWKHCRLSACITYSPRQNMRRVEVCRKHWNALCCEDGGAMRLRRLRKFGYGERELAELDRVYVWQRPADIDETEGVPTMAKKSTKKATSGNKPGKLSGKTTGHSVREHIVGLLEKNAKASRKNRLHDAQLHAKMRAEFPGRTSAQFQNVSGVAAWRGWYNRGGAGSVPKPLSTAYDADGNVLETKRGRKPGNAKKIKKTKTKTKKGAKVRRRK